jgi:biopolymer transport protein TolR
VIWRLGAKHGTIGVSVESLTTVKVLKRRPASAKLVCRIDASALVAVLFILILHLQLIQGTTHGGVSVDVPKVDFPRAIRGARREDAMLVAVFRDGKVLFGNELINSGELSDKIRQSLSKGAERRVYVRADARVRYSAVLDVLEGVRAAGIENVSFFVEQR